MKLSDKLAEALENVQIARRQLDFAIKLLTFCELGRITPSDFDRNIIVRLGKEELCLPSGSFSDARNIHRAASVCVLTAFGVSVLALDQAFDAAGMKANPEASDQIGQLRVLIYMMRCAHAHAIAAPRWNVTNKKFQRTLEFNLDGVSIVLNLQAKNKSLFDVAEIGGYKNWYRMFEAATRALRTKDLAVSPIL